MFSPSPVSTTPQEPPGHFSPKLGGASPDEGTAECLGADVFNTARNGISLTLALAVICALWLPSYSEHLTIECELKFVTMIIKESSSGKPLNSTDNSWDEEEEGALLSDLIWGFGYKHAESQAQKAHLKLDRNEPGKLEPLKRKKVIEMLLR